MSKKVITTKIEWNESLPSLCAEDKSKKVVNEKEATSVNNKEVQG